MTSLANIIMAGKTKKVKFMDSSLINNDVLRPWTIDINLDSKLQQEAIALEKILSFTTPQKFAGTLASSVLDATPMEYKEFKSSMELKSSKYSASAGQGSSAAADSKSPLMSGKSGSNPQSNRSNQSESSRLKDSINEWGSASGSGNNSRLTTPSVDYQDCFDEADMAYIERVKQSMYDKNMRRTKRAQTAPLAPIQGIRYSEGPFGPISPTKSKLMLTAYHNPKLKPGMNAKIVSSHIGHAAHN